MHGQIDLFMYHFAIMGFFFPNSVTKPDLPCWRQEGTDRSILYRPDNKYGT